MWTVSPIWLTSPPHYWTTAGEDPSAIITHRFPIDAYREAFLTARNKTRHQSVKVLLET